MKALLQRLLKFLAYTVAGVVILLAIAVGLFRLFLPRLPEYQEEIKAWASSAVGMEVNFSGMDARWGLSGPEINFYDTELNQFGRADRTIAAAEVRISIALVSLLIDQTLVVDRIVIRDTTIDVQKLDDDRYRIQGRLASELFDFQSAGAIATTDTEIIGEDIELRFTQPGDDQPRYFNISRASVSVDQNRIAIDASVRLPRDLGRQLTISATQVLNVPAEERIWDVSIEADDIHLPGWSNMPPGDDRFRSGTGDFNLSLAFADGQVSKAAAEFDFVDMAFVDNEFFDISGRVEFEIAQDGWLVAANELVISLPDRRWPESSLRVEASTDDDGQIVMLDVRASYLNLDDVHLLQPWLTQVQQQHVMDYAPSGVVRHLVATVSDVDSNAPSFNVAAELQRVGIAAAPGRPGVRGFSGQVRANRSGGRLEIKSTDLTLNLNDYFAGPIGVDLAEGTVIWRSSSARTTILSDSIRINSGVFHSQSNVQLTLDNDGSAPDIDLASTWSIADVAAVTRLLPQKIMQPKLYDWFQMALVHGSIPRGTMQLNGPLDKFPFDDGEGRLLIEASIRDMTLKYHRRWPATEYLDMEIVIDNAQLYSLRNRSTNTANEIVDAKVNIADLRDPVLEIQSFSTGTLESVRQFVLQSPIAEVFGGSLDRISVSGEASFSLDLTVPLKRVHEFEFVSRVRSNNGTLAIDGFAAPVTDLIGEVTIERDKISSQSLGGRFLGQEINIVLSPSDDTRFAVLATVNGIVTADAVVNELGVPLDGLISGVADYEARILFPNTRIAATSPLTIQIDSDFAGFGFDLPQPVAKETDASLLVRADIRFMPGGEVIETAGFAEGKIAWQLAFSRLDEAWDFDRGVVTMGGSVMEPAATRGLHIRGNTGVVRLDDWLSLSRSGEKKNGVAERIRSIDLLIDDLYIVGQHLQGHRVRVDRSARDWLVQLDGDDVIGSVFVPYDFGSERAMVFNMEKLRLPGDEAGDGTAMTLDPRTLPPITLSAAEFAFGDRYIGAVEVTIEKVADGLIASKIVSKDDSFEIVATGRWLADDNDPLGSHSYLTASLISTDVEQTMARLNYQPGIVSDDMTMKMELDWPGSPRADFFDVLDGDVQLNFGNGQLEEVEPGAGRVFGLMSLSALERRLSFDFRDVFGKGFGFDKITATFRIDDGKVYTCDLSLEGPAADIGIVGEADLANRTYNQTAIVSANVGATLPIVGAVVAGPQVAAVLLIVSQIFKKPLQEIGQVYYGIGGSWDEPTIDTTNSAAFVASGELASCLDDAG